jgi:hypothetical protein
MAPARHRLAGSQIFQPYRALGFVTNHVPFVLQSKGTEHFVTTCIGSAYHQYNACIWATSESVVPFPLRAQAIDRRRGLDSRLRIASPCSAAS